MTKQTAVEWLFGETLGLTLQLENKRISHRNWELQMVKLFEKAKEMEKEQIEGAYNDGAIGAFENTYKGMHEYYEQTYGGNK